jgi:hypothetical protein
MSVSQRLQGGRADLKALQGKIKRDPEGYKEEFLLQFRHYHALLVRRHSVCSVVVPAMDAKCRRLKRRAACMCRRVCERRLPDTTRTAHRTARSSTTRTVLAAHHLHHL